MRKIQKVALVGAVLGSIGALGGTAFAHGEQGAHDTDIMQNSECRSHDMNIDVLGSVGVLNALAANALNGEGAPGAQSNHLGADMGCNSKVG
ncbi:MULTISPECIES: hypothetical protein [unclassified Streptomyces]|uniref:hypothetical protein n=1 Tax=unclassified Streptomyces TaxID=2593676 RepID=UPI00382A5D00